MYNDKNNYCIILCGGIGNRLWPYSRHRKPKQFLDLLGIGQTMLQTTFNRIKNIIPLKNIFLVTTKYYIDTVKEQLPEVDANNIITEPVSFGTAPATALAATFIYKENPDANILVTPSDQMIVNEMEFRKQIAECLNFVDSSENFVVVGVKPSHPETSYGYIQAGNEKIGNFSKVKSFTEKPNSDFAQMFCESGEFFWSTGLFLFKMKSYLKVYGESHPNLTTLLNLIDKGISREDMIKYINEQYPRTLFQPIDMLILEHCPNVYVKVCTFGWADIGSWNNLYNISQKSTQGNVIINSKVEPYNSHNNIIRVQDKVVLVKGIENYMIVENENVLVICPKDDTSLLRRMQTDALMKYGDDLG